MVMMLLNNFNHHLPNEFVKTSQNDIFKFTTFELG